MFLSFSLFLLSHFRSLPPLWCSMWLLWNRFEGQQQYQVFVSIFNRKTLEASLFNLLFCFCCSLSPFKHTHTIFLHLSLFFIFLSFALLSFIACYWAVCVCGCLCVCACYIPYNPIHISHHRMNCNMAFVHIFFNFFSFPFPFHACVCSNATDPYIRPSLRICV